MSWPMVKLGDVCTINPRLPKNIDLEQEVTFLAMAAVSEKGEISSQETRILHETKKGFTYFERGDVLLAKITPCFENGKATLTNSLNTQIGFGSTEFHVLRAIPELSLPEYIFYLIWNEKFRIAAAKEMTGSAGQKRVSADYLKQYQFYLPSIFEQEKIVSTLNKGYSIHRKRQQAIKLADDFLRATFLEMFGDPVENPKGWDVASLLEYGSFKNGMNFSKGESGATIKCLGVGDFKSLATITCMDNIGEIELNTLPSTDYLLNDGDLVFVRSNGNKALVGRCLTIYPGKEKVTFSGFCIRYRIEKPAITPEYLNFLFRTPSIKQQMLSGGQGANIQNISQGTLSALRIPVPPLDKQLAFARLVDFHASIVKKQYNKMAESERLFDALTGVFFTFNE
ncbi:restriction endonuclease subunit S [Salmonella enterica]|nr:restriction endonuclease subunit S [Salmonella enterica]ELR4953169.1 restriction endonuclease subunit S [Salmonella enterica]